MNEKSIDKLKHNNHYLFVKMNSGGKPKTSTDRSTPVDRKGLKKWLVNNAMLVVTLTGVFVGIAMGFALRSYNLGADALLLISYPGELFMRVLKLMILPLIIASLIAGSASLNTKMSGKIAVRTLLFFVLTSAFNAFLGIVLAVLIHPGEPDLETDYMEAIENKRDHSLVDSLLDLGRNIFPDNIVQAAFQQAHTSYTKAPLSVVKNLTENGTISEAPIRVVSYRSGTNTLGLVFFCLVFGSILGTLGSKGQVVVDFFQAIFEVTMKMVSGVMWFTPLGVASIIAGKILGVNNVDRFATQEWTINFNNAFTRETFNKGNKSIALSAFTGQVMTQLGWFTATVAVGVFSYQLVIMQFLYFMFLKKNPYKFYWGLTQAMVTASATASTAAALPVTFRCMEGHLRVDPRITRFVLPVGCNINMDGTALFLAVSSIFICQMNGIQLGFGELCTVFLTSTAASLSSASVPSAALVLLLVVLAAVDAPSRDVSLLFAVDWFVDRIRTTNNMLGDCYAAAIVECLSKKELMACDSAALDSMTIDEHLKTPSVETEVEINTPDEKALASNHVVIDMHLTTSDSTKYNT